MIALLLATQLAAAPLAAPPTVQSFVVRPSNELIRALPYADATRIFLYGESRGAIMSLMAARELVHAPK